VPKPRIRKIEPNPAFSIQSFLLEEEKNMVTSEDGGVQGASSPKQGQQQQPMSPRKQQEQTSPKNGARPVVFPRNGAGDENNKIPGWSFVKKPITNFRKQ
jgi:hypothetical protein